MPSCLSRFLCPCRAPTLGTDFSAAKDVAGAPGAARLALEEIAARAGLVGLEVLELRLVDFRGIALVAERLRLRLVFLDPLSLAAGTGSDRKRGERAELEPQATRRTE